MGGWRRTELQRFVDMLARAGIAHGKRVDENPPGTGVQVEFENRLSDTADFQFDEHGNLVGVVLCRD